MTTPFVTSDNALKTEEFSLLEPGVLDNQCHVKLSGVDRAAEVRADAARSQGCSTGSMRGG